MLFLSAVVVALLAGPDPAVAAIPSTLQSILKNTHGSKEYGYPTDLTRDLLPVSSIHDIILRALMNTVEPPTIWTMLLTLGATNV